MYLTKWIERDQKGNLRTVRRNEPKVLALSSAGGPDGPDRQSVPCSAAQILPESGYESKPPAPPPSLQPEPVLPVHSQKTELKTQNQLSHDIPPVKREKVQKTQSQIVDNSPTEVTKPADIDLAAENTKPQVDRPPPASSALPETLIFEPATEERCACVWVYRSHEAGTKELQGLKYVELSCFFSPRSSADDTAS
ncbi:hypothetical protein MMC25_004123 [Agyrium rufum]|nr:hypothetical protein [Agyrium rufum]